MHLLLFGAGNIGRSFIGPVFSEAGYHVTFVDVNLTVVDALNKHRSYPVVTVAPDGSRTERVVADVSAIDGRDADAVGKAVARADIAATAVGAGGFETVCRSIASGIHRRVTMGRREPLDIILAENIPGAAELARRTILATIGPGRSDSPPPFGLVGTSIGKMVPIVPEEVAATDPLTVFAEPYNTLIVDRLAFAGPVPAVPDLLAVDNIRAYVDRKLFIHNLGHAAVAYLACARDSAVDTIAGAMSLPGIREAARTSMTTAAAGIRARYPGEFAPGTLEEHVHDLLSRFLNPALGDTVFRVGRDLRRKLGRDDRIVGALRMLAGCNLPMENVARVYRAALNFTATDETGTSFPGDAEIIARAAKDGPESILTDVSCLDRTDPVDRRVMDAVLNDS